MKHKLLISCTILLTLSLAAATLMVPVGGAAPSNQPALAGALPMSPEPCDPFSFGPAANFGSDQENHAVAVGDFNGDGRKDIVYAGGGGDENNPNRYHGSISVLLGDGTGGFSAPANPLRFGGVVHSMTLGEFTGDGSPDIAALWYDNETGQSGLWTLLGNAAGGFGGGYYKEGYFSSLAAGDFNSDSKQDIAAGVGGTLSVLLGDGAGSFALAANVVVPHAELAVGDFNADGNQDLVTNELGPNGPGPNVSLLLSMGDGSFAEPVYFSAGDEWSVSIRVADFNHDGNQDLVTVNDGTLAVSVLFGMGDGNFGTATGFAVGDGPYSVVVGDFNGDGNNDIATRHSGHVGVLVGNGSGGFETVNNTGAYGGSPATGDFNGDRREDIVTVENYAVSVFLAQCGVPTPTPTPPTAPTPTPTPLVTVGGRALTANGKGIHRADVGMTDGASVTMQTLTDKSGNFSFANVPAGRSYTFTAAKRGVQFTNGTQIIFVAGDINNLTFNALP